MAQLFSGALIGLKGKHVLIETIRGFPGLDRFFADHFRQPLWIVVRTPGKRYGFALFIERDMYVMAALHIAYM